MDCPTAQEKELRVAPVAWSPADPLLLCAPVDADRPLLCDATLFLMNPAFGSNFSITA